MQHAEGQAQTCSRCSMATRAAAASAASAPSASSADAARSSLQRSRTAAQSGSASPLENMLDAAGGKAVLGWLERSRPIAQANRLSGHQAAGTRVLQKAQSKLSQRHLEANQI